MNNKNHEYLSFDCYGTLINWEKGILNFFNAFLKDKNIEVNQTEILNLYAQFEAKEEHGEYKSYKEILRGVLKQFAQYFGFSLLPAEEYLLADSVKVWPPFEDSNEALKRLQAKYKLVIISNIDDELFEFSEALLGIKFDHVFTAYQMKSYKPSLHNFQYVQKALTLTQENWLHVAQSLYHDHVPASKLGIDSVWIKRASMAGEQGVAPKVDINPAVKFSDLKSFTDWILT